MAGGLDRSENASPLLPEEIVWRNRNGTLESHGYRLRPRFRPDWKPSWVGSKRHPMLHEDYSENWSDKTIDAVRISDGQKVFLKRVHSNSRELAIHRYLSDKEKLSDPRNHTAPLLDDFLDDDDQNYTFLVLPLLRKYDEPEFFSVDEVVDFMRQVLEGLTFMHKHNIAHRDCSHLNIMMDADKIFPHGFHPTRTLADSTGYKLAKPKRRREVSYVRYYFIDFGISSMFDAEESNKKVYGVLGQDDEVPELSDYVPYNPFYADVFILGNLFRKAFLEKYTNLAFLGPLIRDMTQHNWRDRCNAFDALEMFKTAAYTQPWYKARWRLKARTAGRGSQLLQDIGTFSRETVYLAKTSIRASFHNTMESLRRKYSKIYRKGEHA